MSVIITALQSISSAIDPKVKFEVQKPRQGSAQWDQVVFNGYCYEKAGNAGNTERRTRAMADLFGQAAKLLAEKDPEGNLSVRTFYKAQDGSNTPRLHIVIRPTTGQSTSAPSMDVNADLAAAVEKATELGFDFGTVPAVIAGSPAAFLGYLRKQVASLGTAAVNSEIAAAPGATVDNGAPPL